MEDEPQRARSDPRHQAPPAARLHGVDGRPPGLEPSRHEVRGLADARAARGVVGDQPLGEQDLVHPARIAEAGRGPDSRRGRWPLRRTGISPDPNTAALTSTGARRPRQRPGPARPAPVERPVAIPAGGGVVLSGTLTVPAGPRPASRRRCSSAASGPTNRDGSFGDGGGRRLPRHRPRPGAPGGRGAALRQARHRRFGRTRAQLARRPPARRRRRAPRRARWPPFPASTPPGWR